MLEELKDSDPRKVGPYQPVGRLGSGSFGTVYAAYRDRAESRAADGNPAAVKVFRSDLSDTVDFFDRFNGEIDAIKRVQSDYVPRFIDAQVDSFPAWMATQLIPGLSLEEIVSSSAPLSEDAVWQLGVGLIEALTALHAARCLHHDLRPRNVLVSLDGPWLVDFSLANLGDRRRRESPARPRGDHEFMSPEEMQDGIDAAREPADIFGLAGTLVFAATKHPLLQSRAHAQEGKYNLDGLPDSLRDQIEQCLHRDPRHRIGLDQLKTEFDRRAASSARDGLTALLSEDVRKRLDRHRAGLVRALAVDSPERLGWTAARRISPGGRRAGAQTRPRQNPVATSVGGPVGSALPRPPEWTSGGLGSWISGPAAVRADKVVLASLEGKVIALNTADGKPAWRRPVDVSSTLHAGILLDRYGDGPVCAYVGGADGRLHEVDLIARRDRVLLEAAAPIQGTPVRAGERLCALSADGQVHAVDPASGERRVLHQMGTPAVGSLAAAAGAIYAAGADGGLRSIDASTGQLNWQFPTKGLVVAKPLVAVDAIYVGGTDCVLRRIAAGNGRQLHASELSAPVHADPAHYGNRLYIASGDGVVHAYDIGPRTPTRLEELWSHPLEEEVSGLAAAARGHIYIAAGRRLVKLTEVDLSARRPSLLLTTDSLIAASPTISAERCYVVSLSGQVSCLRLSLPMVRI